MPATTNGFDPDKVLGDLQRHAEICRECLALAEAENQRLREAADFPAADSAQRRRELLPRIESSLRTLRSHRLQWQQLPATERLGHPEVARALRITQELVMRVVLLERENDQALLRHGLLPAAHLPPVQGQQPHFVSALYQRHQRF